MSAHLFPGISRSMCRVLDATGMANSAQIKLDTTHNKVVISNATHSLGFMIPYDDNHKVEYERLNKRAIATAVAWSRTMFELKLEPWL